jgi:MOSC domain-containing protein YiiM
MTTSWTIDAVLTGRVAPLRGEEPSAIAKTRRNGRVAVTTLGLDGDEQADRMHHGGPDMAIHHYPRDHYSHWRVRTGSPLLDHAGALGENISTRGLNDETACIGDRYRLGSALVEVSQGRAPCWKPAHRLGYKPLTAEIVTTGRAGWYYRVLEVGAVAEGDALTLLDRPNPAWTVARAFGLLVRGDRDPEALRALAELPTLSAHWRRKAATRAG